MSFVPAHEHLTGRGHARRWYLPQVLLLIADSGARCENMLGLAKSCEPRRQRFKAGFGLLWERRAASRLNWTTFSFVHQVSYRRERGFLNLAAQFDERAQRFAYASGNRPAALPSVTPDNET